MNDRPVSFDNIGFGLQGRVVSPAKEHAPAAKQGVLRRAPMPFAFGCLLLFMLVYYARPEDWLPGVRLLPLAKITGVLMILALLFSLGKIRGRLPKEVIYISLLAGWLFCTVPFSTVWRGGAFSASVEFVKILPAIFVIVWVVNSLPRLRKLLYLQTTCVVVISMIVIWRGRVLHGRLEGVLNGNYANPNDLACQMVICLPFCVAFLIRARNIVWKLAWAFAIVVLSYVTVLTGSRAGILAFGVAMAVCIWEYAVKGRYKFLLIFAVAGVIMLGLFGGQVLQRFAAIGNASEDATAHASAEIRKKIFIESFAVTATHPLFGVGPGNFQVLSGSWHSSHDIFLQLSTEAGLPALILYLMILGRAFSNMRKIKRARNVTAEARIWAKALYATLLGFSVGSFFAPEAYQYFVYFLFMYSTVLFAIVIKDQARLPDTTKIISPLRNDKEMYAQRPELYSA
jgi:putative inorganic carbon (hco3(-)) transporter